MERILFSLHEAFLERGYVFSKDLDPYETGLLGEEFSPLTTTLGDERDKRTSAHPLFTVALEGCFEELGLKKGDVVAVGASGSFPGLLFAALAACEARDLEALVICSLGSSMYGANRPGFTVVDMVRELQERGVLSCRLLGYSLGGRNDRNEAPLFPEWGPLVTAEARRLGGNCIMEPTLEASVARRAELYEEAAAGAEISCFVGVGGAGVTFGGGEEGARFPNGLTRHSFEGMPQEGLFRYYLERGVPVIHLLCVRKLCETWNIPYDANPFDWRKMRP